MARPVGNKQPTVNTSFRVPVTVYETWGALARKMALPRTSVLVIAIRELAKKEGVTEGPYIEESEEDSTDGNN